MSCYDVLRVAYGYAEQPCISSMVASASYLESRSRGSRFGLKHTVSKPVAFLLSPNNFFSPSSSRWKSSDDFCRRYACEIVSYILDRVSLAWGVTKGLTDWCRNSISSVAYKRCVSACFEL